MTRDHAIAAIAGRQHGVIALRQLVALGLGERAVNRRVAAGRLHRVHPGVYAVGHSSLTARGRWMAAVLACGDGAVLAIRSAGALHGIRESASPRNEVYVPRRSSGGPEGIEVRGRPDLTGADVTLVDGIPCTSVARTLLDLAAVLGDAAVENAIDRAEQLRLFDGRAVDDMLARKPGRRAAAPRPCEPQSRQRPDAPRVRAAVLRVLPRPGPAIPRVNVPIQLEDTLFIADFLWPSARHVRRLPPRPAPGPVARPSRLPDAPRDLAGPQGRARSACRHDPAPPRRCG